MTVTVIILQNRRQANLSDKVNIVDTMANLVDAICFIFVIYKQTGEGLKPVSMKLFNKYLHAHTHVAYIVGTVNKIMSWLII